MPWSVVCCATLQHLLEGVFVVVPVFSFLEVFVREFPVFFGDLQTFFKAIFLFLFGDVQKDLDDLCACFVQQGFKLIDLLVTRTPDGFGDNLMDTNGQYVFVMRTIEDADHACGGNRLVYAPQIVVFQLSTSRGLE